MKRKTLSKIASVMMSALLMAGFCGGAVFAANIPDGALSVQMTNSQGQPAEMKLSKENGTFCIQVIDSSLQYTQIPFGFDGSWDWHAFVLSWDHSSLTDQYGNPVAGASFADEYDDALGKFVTTIFIPQSYFGSENISINGVAASAIPETSSSTPAPEVPDNSGNGETTPAPLPDGGNASYEGIAIDGNFDDWNGVAKVADADANVDYASFVWDGDYLYIYFEFTGNPNQITWSGDHSNGKFELSNELNELVLFQLTQNEDARVAGVTGATCMTSSNAWGQDVYKWEIAIPASNLPAGTQSVSFGHYLSPNKLAENVSNMQSSGDTPARELAALLLDGQYDDWTNYPKTQIHYATSGTGEHMADALGALIGVDDGFMGYAETCMPAHLNEAGMEFTSGTMFKINSQFDFMPQFVTVGADGSINYLAKVDGLAPGTYEFTIIDAQGWKNAENIAQWDDPNDYRYKSNGVYGKAIITIGASKDQMEYVLFSDKLAEKFDMSDDQLHTMSVKHQRLGDDWIYTAGVSTGPFLGIALCLASTGAVLWKKKKGNR